jgi:tight adherence protein C
MTDLTLLSSLFLVVMTATTLVGYWLAVRPFSDEREAPQDRRTALHWFGEMAPATSRDGDGLRKRLAAAGYRQPSAMVRFRGLRFAACLFMAAAGFGMGIVTHGNSAIAAMCGGALAYLLPDRILGFRVRARQRRLRAGLPAALDLLVLAIEAGQGLDAAVLETSRGLAKTYPELSQELNILSVELRTSTSRVDSLRALSERNGETELSKLAALFIDTDRFGTSLGPALRNHSRYLRIRLRQQAQERARKIGVKLIFPVFFLIFPSVILITLGPAVMLISNQMNEFMK